MLLASYGSESTAGSCAKGGESHLNAASLKTEPFCVFLRQVQKRKVQNNTQKMLFFAEEGWQGWH